MTKKRTIRRRLRDFFRGPQGFIGQAGETGKDGTCVCVRDDLRAKVEALPIWEDDRGWLVMSYLDVVALIDGMPR